VSTRRSTTTVETKVSVKAALERAPAGTLTAEEERVVRMRSGSSPDSRAPLGLVGQEHPETRAKLAMLEQMALQAMRRPAPAPAAETPNPVKAHLLRRLRETPDRAR
jgi:DNA-directed RNA polymerase sigma subunit (sigma70/sigma32)